MALQVWLPLNGNTDNQGLSNVTITSSGTVNSNGKIGSCYACKSGNYVSFSSDFGIAPEFTIAFWVKVPQTITTVAAWQAMINFPSVNNTSNTPCQISWASYNQMKIFDESNHQHAWITLAYDTWIHYAITNRWDGTNNYIDIYQNGIKYGSYTSSKALKIRGGTWYLGSGINATYGPIYYNDFRIYDHALSAKEVKEISKGLILHYKLDGNGKGGDNLLYNTNTANINLFGFSEQTGGSNKTIEYDGWIPCIKVTRNSTAHSGWSYIYHNNLNHSAIKTSTTYTISFDAIASGSGSIGLQGFMNGNGTNNLSGSNKVIQNTFNSTSWSHIIFRTTTKSSFDGLSVGNQIVYMSCSFMTSTEVWIKVKNFKVEEGTADTPWCPNSRDALYTTLGYNDSTTEYDSSGYCNHGSITGTLTTNSDSPRYTTSTEFGSGKCIRPSLLPSFLTNEATVSMWVKLDQLPPSSPGRTLLYTVWNGFSCEIMSSGKTYFRVYLTSGLKDSPLGTIATGNWVHWVGVKKSTGISLYLDGVLVGTTSNSDNFSWSSGNNTIGCYSNTYYLYGKLSDVRLYATALSDDDVKELYNTSAFVTNNGVFAEYELYEDNLSDVKKTGLLETANFYENGAESGYALDTDKTRVASNYIISEEFIEI